MAGIKDVARSAGVSPEVVKDIFAAMINMMGQDGSDSVKVQGFGSFRVNTIAARTVASPVINGGEPLALQPQLSIKFTPSALARRRLNKMAAQKLRAASANKRLIENPPKKAQRPGQVPSARPARKP